MSYTTYPFPCFLCTLYIFVPRSVALGPSISLHTYSGILLSQTSYNTVQPQVLHVYNNIQPQKPLPVFLLFVVVFKPLSPVMFLVVKFTSPVVGAYTKMELLLPPGFKHNRENCVVSLVVVPHPNFYYNNAGFCAGQYLEFKFFCTKRPLG